MAQNQHGGYRRPSDPAPVSGPGALSQRTDGGATQAPMLASGGPYGSRQDMASIQGSAPMAGTPAPSRDMLTPLTAPTARPGEPVTAGVDAGPGMSAAAAGIRSDSEISDEQMRPLLRSLELMANLPGSNPETRTFVRALKARLSNA